jgi:cleavage and polyadenylation specificity factor subunit 1
LTWGVYVVCPCVPQAYKPYNGKLGFRQLPLGPAVLGHESPSPPAAAAAAAVSGIQGMPAADTPPTRLARFDHLATPRLDPPLGPGFRPPGLNPSDSLAGSESGRGLNPGAGGLPLLHYSGVFVCGPKPLWLVATRGGLVVHPMDGVTMGAVDAFCGFHNVNCPHGYIAAALEGDMRVCSLPLQVRVLTGEVQPEDVRQSAASSRGRTGLTSHPCVSVDAKGQSGCGLSA